MNFHRRLDAGNELTNYAAWAHFISPILIEHNVYTATAEIRKVRQLASAPVEAAVYTNDAGRRVDGEDVVNAGIQRDPDGYEIPDASIGVVVLPQLDGREYTRHRSRCQDAIDQIECGPVVVQEPAKLGNKSKLAALKIDYSQAELDSRLGHLSRIKYTQLPVDRTQVVPAAGAVLQNPEVVSWGAWGVGSDSDLVVGIAIEVAHNGELGRILESTGVKISLHAVARDRTQVVPAAGAVLHDPGHVSWGAWGVESDSDLVVGIAIEVAHNGELGRILESTGVEISLHAVTRDRTQVVPAAGAVLQNPEVVSWGAWGVGSDSDLVVAIAIEVAHNGELGRILESTGVEISLHAVAHAS